MTTSSKHKMCVYKNSILANVLDPRMNGRQRGPTAAITAMCSRYAHMVALSTPRMTYGAWVDLSDAYHEVMQMRPLPVGVPFIVFEMTRRLGRIMSNTLRMHRFDEQVAIVDTLERLAISGSRLHRDGTADALEMLGIELV